MPSKPVIAVVGDVTIDWNILRAEEAVHVAWTGMESVRMCRHDGGAAGLADLLAALARRSSFAVARGVTLPKTITPSDPGFHHSFATWSRFREGKTDVWRVHSFLGLQHARSEKGPARGNSSPVEVLVIDDAGLGYREKKQAWVRDVARTGSGGRVVLKISGTAIESPMWRHVRSKARRRLVSVVTASDLRLLGVQISRESSWERAAEDTVWALQHDHRLAALAESAHVIVSFGPVGALRFTPGTGANARSQAEARLRYDPDSVEGEWNRQHPGGMIGYTTCLAAAVARELALPSRECDLDRAIERGVAASRILHTGGFRADTQTPPVLSFPTNAIAEEIVGGSQHIAVASVPLARAASSPPWSILRDACCGALARDIGELARRIVERGVESELHDVPDGRFGALVTVDRSEIEAYRDIAGFINEYLAHPKQKTPLSLAVFGPPGAGKSFGVEQVARSIAPGRVEPLTFNVAQFVGEHDLVAAFHQVRDVCLRGKVPLTFWDEFDANRLSWLRLFLAPMQDGVFREGPVMHPVGQAIFVFAGGTSATRAEFGKTTDPDDFKALKGPDFLRRLRGSLNVLGPNPVGSVADDPVYIIRRAILLRSMLQRAAPEIFTGSKLNMDPGVLRALLRIRHYRHGAGSMQQLIAMSRLTGESSFQRSSLPSESQIDSQVDARAFLALVDEIELDNATVERLAKAAHEVYRRGIGGTQRTAASARAYAKLGRHEKDQNRDLVRAIPAKLARIDCVIVPNRGSMFDDSMSDDVLDLLARDEHTRWLRLKLAEQWRYATKRDDGKKRHPAMKLWDEENRRDFSAGELKRLGAAPLPEDEKQKDRDLMRGIPAILEQAGYRIVRVGSRD